MTESPNSTKEQAFWEWFRQNEDMLLRHSHTDENGEEILDLVLEAMQEVDKHLVFEFGPPEPKREFIVSAGGIRASFPAVLRLQQAQPLLERWVTTYFQPRRDPISTIAMGDLTINSRDMEFSILSRDTDIGLEVFVPGYDDTDPRFKQIGYLFLDQALGEFDVETKVSYLRFFAETEPPMYQRIPFAELPERFDDLYNRLNGFTGRPS